MKQKETTKYTWCLWAFERLHFILVKSHKQIVSRTDSTYLAYREKNTSFDWLKYKWERFEEIYKIFGNELEKIRNLSFKSIDRVLSLQICTNFSRFFFKTPILHSNEFPTTVFALCLKKCLCSFSLLFGRKLVCLSASSHQ